MPRYSIWDVEHVDFLETLVRAEELTGRELATRMSKQFHRRVTLSQINVLLQRMRTSSDPYYRDIPYRRKGARYQQ